MDDERTNERTHACTKRASRARRFRRAKANRQQQAGGAAGVASGKAIKLTIVEHDGSSGNLHGKGSPRDAGRDIREGQDARHYRELVADRNRRQLQQRVLQNMF